MSSEPELRQSLAAQILDWIRKCLAQIRPAADVTNDPEKHLVASSGSPMEAQGMLADKHAVGILLEKMRAAKIDATGGMIQMVQLGDARKAFGDQWPKMAETAMSLAETLLMHRLDQSDIFCRYLAYGFVVVFTGLKPDKAERRAEALSKEISHLLLKVPELKEAFGALQVTGPISELTGPDGTAPLETMARKLEAMSQSKNQENGTKPVGNIPDPVPSSQTKPATTTASAPSPESKAPPPPKMPTAVAKEPPTPKKAPTEPSLVAAYQPMLLVPKRTVGISVGVPRRRDNDGEWLTGNSAYTRGLGGDHNRSLDLFMCKQVVADLRRTAKAGDPAIVAGMARIESLSASSKFGDIYSTLSEAERNRFILEIVALDKNMPVSKIQEIFGRYRSVTKNIVLHVAPGSSEFRKYADVGVAAISCQLKDDKPDEASVSKTAKLARAFGLSAKKAGLRCYIHGVANEETLSAAIAGGAQYVSGSIIGPLADNPFAPYPFTAAAATSDAA